MKIIKLSLTLMFAVVVAVVGYFAAGRKAPDGVAGTTAAMAQPGTLPPVSTMLVASPTRLTLATNEGMAASTLMSVRYGGGDGHLEVAADSDGVFVDPVVTPLGGGAFNVALATSDVIPEGGYKGRLLLRMCTDATCNSVVATTAVPYTLSVRWPILGEWETYQRDAGHRGYVPMVVDVARFRKAWEWQNPTGMTINTVTTGPGRVFVSEAYSTGGPTPVSRLYSLREIDGSQAWQQEFAVGYASLNPPATSGDNVYIASTGHENTFLFALRQSDGAPVFQSTFSSQWADLLAPTIANGVAYTAGGYYGGGTHAYAAETGTPLWSRYNGDDDMSTPAVENGKVYHYDDSSGLHVYDSANGNTLASIADPVPYDWWGYSYNSAPMLGAPDHVFAMSSNAQSRFIVNYSPSANASRWTSERRYVGSPAYKDGVVYATSNNPKSFDALDAQTGEILWSWVPGSSSTAFQGNVVLTSNVAFVSTNAALHAIDLATRQSVWSVPVPGNVAISGAGMLYLQPLPAGQPKLLAYRLR